MRRIVVAVSLLLACAGGGAHGHASAPGATAPDATSFLVGALRAWPRDDSIGLLAVTNPSTGRVATYDSALVVLALLRMGQRDRAARVLQGLAALQGDDGGIPFSFALPAPDAAHRYERAGAIAWIGYAAAEYLDAERGGPSRDVALRLAHRAAAYLLARQVTRPGDPRDGLVSGGTGTINYEMDGNQVREAFSAGEVSWTSVEHNIDTYFFLRALARVTELRAYADAAARIGGALVARAWSSEHGQFVEGLDASGPDETLALDCAAWGSILLDAIGEAARADTAFAVADGRYATADGHRGAVGHRPYARGPIFADERLMRHFVDTLRATRWERLEAVWPEGSAGVALSAWRAGHADRARAILDALEPLRSPDGSLPTSTAAVPFLLDTQPSIAATAWVALVRFELDRPRASPTLWAP
jgi:hypothetical protein